MLASLKENFYFPFRLFTFLAVFFLFGILLGNLFNIKYEKSVVDFLLILGLSLLVAFLNFIWKNKLLAVASWWLFATTLGLFYYSYYDFKSRPVLPLNKEIEITGVVSNKPVSDYKKQSAMIKVTYFGPAKKLASKELILVKNGRWQIDFTKSESDFYPQNESEIYLQLSLPAYPEYHYGETLNFTGKIEEPTNFNDFDYKSYLMRYHIFGVVKQPEKVIFLGNNRDASTEILAFLYQIPDQFERIFDQVLTQPHASLAAGILLGSKENLPDNFSNNLKIVGLTHIIALSGFNVTIIISVLSLFLIGMIGRRQTFMVGTVFVFLFVLMTGASMSVVRAAIFSILILFGKTIGKKADETNIMLLAALVMVLGNPYILKNDAGFQLSFLAFCGIIYFAKPIEKLLNKKIKKVNVLNKPLAETLGAQFAVMPIMFFQFGSISLISPIANLLIVWSIPLVMLLSFILVILGLFSLSLANVAGLLLWPLLDGIIILVNLLAKIPFASINVN